MRERGRGVTLSGVASNSSQECNTGVVYSNKVPRFPGGSLTLVEKL